MTCAFPQTTNHASFIPYHIHRSDRKVVVVACFTTSSPWMSPSAEDSLSSSSSTSPSCLTTLVASPSHCLLSESNFQTPHELTGLRSPNPLYPPRHKHHQPSASNDHIPRPLHHRPCQRDHDHRQPHHHLPKVFPSPSHRSISVVPLTSTRHRHPPAPKPPRRSTRTTSTTTSSRQSSRSWRKPATGLT